MPKCKHLDINKKARKTKTHQCRTVTKIVVTSPNVCLQLQVTPKENIPNIYLSVSAHDFGYASFCSVRE